MKIVEKNVLSCDKKHKLIKMTSTPDEYPSGPCVRCNLCKKSPLEEQGYFHHCKKCSFDLCIKCETSRYKKIGEF